MLGLILVMNKRTMDMYMNIDLFKLMDLRPKHPIWQMPLPGLDLHEAGATLPVLVEARKVAVTLGGACKCPPRCPRRGSIREQLFRSAELSASRIKRVTDILDVQNWWVCSLICSDGWDIPRGHFSRS